MTTTNAKNEMIKSFMGWPDSYDLPEIDWTWLMLATQRINQSDGYTCLSIDSDMVFVHRKDGVMLDFPYKDSGMMQSVYDGVCAAIEWIQMEKV